MEQQEFLLNKLLSNHRRRAQTTTGITGINEQRTVLFIEVAISLG